MGALTDHMADWRELGRSRTGLQKLIVRLSNSRNLESYAIAAIAEVQHVIERLPARVWRDAADRARVEALEEFGSPGREVPAINDPDDINLTPFCATEETETRSGLRAPFSCDEWTYATDARVLVRVIRRNAVPMRDGDHNNIVRSLFRDYWPHGDALWSKIPPLAPDAESYLIGPRRLNRDYLALLATLPEVTAAFQGGTFDDPLPFRFAGYGAGFLMPMKPFDPDSSEDAAPIRLEMERSAT